MCTTLEMEVHHYCDLRYDPQQFYVVHMILPVRALRTSVTLLKNVSLQHIFTESSTLSKWTYIFFKILYSSVRISDNTPIPGPVIYMSLPVYKLDGAISVNTILTCRFAFGDTFEDINILCEDLFSAITETQTTEGFFHLTVNALNYLTESKNHTANAYPGPLEAPSHVRGLEINESRKDAYPELKETKEPNKNWYVVAINEIRLYKSDMRAFGVSYAGSHHTRPQMTNATIPRDTLNVFTFEIELLIAMGRTVLESFFEAVADTETLSQLFLCHIPVDDKHLLATHAYHAQEVWVTSLSFSSCIIKGILAHVGIKYKTETFLNSLSTDEYWADIINTEAYTVVHGKRILLTYDKTTGLLTSNTSYQFERTFPYSVLYINKNLECIWSFSGGFAQRFKVSIPRKDVDLLLSRFTVTTKLHI